MLGALPNSTCEDGICWQKLVAEQARLEYEASGKPRFWEDIDLDLKKSVVRPVSRAIAEKIILKYEWLGDMAITDTFYGIFFEEFCAGVICICSYGVYAGNGLIFGIKDRYLSYFARGACTFWAPKGTASRLLSVATRLEAKRGQKACIAYSDPNAGEVGTVYQACNWYCLGRTAPSKAFSNGKRHISDRTLSNFAGRKKIKYSEAIDMFLQNGYELIRIPPKFRYGKILATGEEGRAIYEKIKPLITPYPKREDIFKQQHAAEGLAGGRLATSEEGAFDSTLPL